MNFVIEVSIWELILLLVLIKKNSIVNFVRDYFCSAMKNNEPIKTLF